jgi:group I intron endonuclease
LSDSGIYCIENVLSGAKYIGKCKSIKKRTCDHKKDLRAGTHGNYLIQQDYNEHGMDIFRFYTIQEMEFDLEKLELMEIYWISYLETFHGDGNGYNLTRGGRGNLGWILRESTKQNISKANSNVSEERSKRMTEWQISTKNGRPCASQYVGVTLRKSIEMYRSYIRINKKKKEIGLYHTEVAAAYAYNQKAIEVYGDKAKLNIISDEELRIALEIEESFKPKHSSKYECVTWSNDKNKFAARVKFKGIVYFLGYYKFEIEAALCVNEALTEFYGYKAKLNPISQDEIDWLWNQD